MAVSVLVVEDDKNIAELLQMYLEKEGYAVTVALDGGQGLAKFRAIQPDLVLLDLMLPVMDGWAVCRSIRAESQTPIIMLTAKGETSDKVAGLKNGADDYITKPFEMKEVLARIEAVLRRSGTTAETKSNKLVFDTFDKAVQENPNAHPMLHSDRGYQYTSRIFHKKLLDAGLTPSMSRVGRCIDNGPMEGFWGILKRECYYGHTFSRESLFSTIENYIDYYNNRRYQYRLFIQTPMQAHVSAMNRGA